MEDGTGQLTRIATGVITGNLQTTTGVQSPGCFRSSIRTDAQMVLLGGVIDYGAGQRGAAKSTGAWQALTEMSTAQLPRSLSAAIPGS